MLVRSLAPSLLMTALALVPGARAADPPRPLTRIAFGSCAQQDKPQPIWDRVVEARPELFLFLGDVIYADTTDPAVMKAKYRQLAGVPGWQRLLRTCPVLAVWDDHDYGGNDAGAEYPKKAESQQIFLDFFNEPQDSPRRRREGIYDARVFGPPDRSVQVILLDTRYFRSPLKKRTAFVAQEGPYLPHDDPAATFLGEAQWQWLEAQLRQPARLRLLASSIQVLAEDHGYEKWMNLPRERERLFRLLRETRANGVVLLSGDRHLAELSVTDANLTYPLYDLTSSGLNQASEHWRKLETNRHRVATMGFGHNFGLVTVDWDKPDPRVALQIRDEDGEVTIQQKLSLSMLQPGFFRDKQADLPRLAGKPVAVAALTKMEGKEVTLEMTVRSTGRSGDLVFLNTCTDRRDDENFTVVLDKSAWSVLEKGGVTQPQKQYEGKTVHVTGTISLFRDRPQIRVGDLQQVKIQGK